MLEINPQETVTLVTTEMVPMARMVLIMARTMLLTAKMVLMTREITRA